ncbi:MAG: 23S rRNA (uracil(1939)-C(5))-methyltransferase RlmD [Peptococcaceae bacterium]|nr:23S rRNA (uracil(1939)-C(5))-methyltransferase RlmD [Peptococcaceae bacterium]
MASVKVTITGLGHEGEGVGRVDGKATFVAGALPGETVLTEIRQQKKNFQRGELREVLEAAPERINPPCPVFGRCGGCQVQQLEYQATLNWKRQKVQDALVRLGKLEQVEVSPVLGMPEPWRYRNKVQLHVGERSGSIQLGYYGHNTNRLVAFDDCLLLPQRFNALKARLEIFFRENGVKPQQVQQVVIRNSPVTGELMVGIIGVLPPLPWQEIRRDFPELKSLVVVDPVSGKPKLAAGQAVINDVIYDNQFAISFASFVQVNPGQTKALYAKVLEYANLQGQEVVLDAYCGIGTITLALAQQARWVIGVEVAPEAIADARANATANKIPNVEFHAATAEELLPQLAAQKLKVDVVVVDPPRKGCEREVLDAIGKLGPKRLVYVSCDPATLARDLGVMQELGYVTVGVQPVDMFPWTAHVETIIRINRA